MTECPRSDEIESRSWASTIRSLHLCHTAIAIAVVMTLAGRIAQGDALVITRAMSASTVVEIFIEKDLIRAEFEIGADDVEAFANALPDQIYKRVTGQDVPLENRLKEFFQSDWQLRADGELLSGQVVDFSVDKRLVRDEVSGDVLADQPDDADLVIRLSLQYQNETQPQILTIQPPLRDGHVAANIGFVCYHEGLHVNDFRYMASEITLDLDWGDPWFSRFRNPNLRRKFDAPLSVFLYIEPYEVRKEIIVRPVDLQGWVDLDLGNAGVIPIGAQAVLKKRAAEFLISKGQVTIDGRTVKPKLDRIHFIRRNLRATGIIEPAEELDLISATLGVIFTYPVDQLPDQVSMTWDMFSPKIARVRASASDEAGGVPSEVTPEMPVLEWVNYLTNPTSADLMKVSVPPSPPSISIPLASLLCAAGFCAALAMSIKQLVASGKVSRFPLTIAVVAAFAGVLSLPWARLDFSNPFVRQEPLTEVESQDIVRSLLHNVYRSFDHHDESLIYDRLSKSVAGDLLAQTYLETRKNMEVKNQGGLRVSVKEVVVNELKPLNNDPSSPTFRCGWQVAGSIGHWGHIHRRTNQHVARLTITPREGVWKITQMELLDEQSLDSEGGTPLTDREADSANSSDSRGTSS